MANLEVSSDSLKAVKAYAEKLGITTTAAADKLIATAVSRLNALARYAKNTKKEGAAAKKPAKKKAAKKAESKKASSIVKPKKKSIASKPKADKPAGKGLPKKKSIVSKPKVDKPAVAETANGVAHA